MRRMRYRLVVWLCWLLRHPAERVEYASGSTSLRCPCGHIEVFTRAFRRE